MTEIKPTEAETKLSNALSADLVASMHLSDFGASIEAINAITQALSNARVEGLTTAIDTCKKLSAVYKVEVKGETRASMIIQLQAASEALDLCADQIGDQQ